MKKLILALVFLPSLSFGAINVQSNLLGSDGLISETSLDNSSVTLLGPSIDLATEVDGTLNNAEIDGASVTKKGAMDNGTANININEVRVASTTSVGPACATGFTRVGLSDCLDTSGTRAVDITSVPVNTTSDFTTTNLAILNSTNAKFAIFSVKCQTSQDATDGTNDVSLYMRKPGGGGTKDNSTNKCNAANRIASAVGENYTSDLNEVLVPLDSNKDFDYACTTVQTDNDIACYITLRGYKE